MLVSQGYETLMETPVLLSSCYPIKHFSNLLWKNKLSQVGLLLI